MVQHIVTAFIGVIFLQWEPSMLVTVKDITDALQNAKYCLGMAGQPVHTASTTIRKNLSTGLCFSGALQMIATGFVLWFPVTATKYLPGQFIPVSKIIHTNDAMLIFLLMIIWHIFDSIFNPEVFPLDKSIFTGFKKPEHY